MVRKKRPAKQHDDDLDFPWEAEGFIKEDTSDYPELEGMAAGATRSIIKTDPGDEASVEDTDPSTEDTDPSTEDTDQSVEDTSEILEDGEDESAAASRKAAHQADPTPGERFFPDIPELARDEEGSTVSGLLRTADEISRIITLNRPRPGPFLRWYFSLDLVKRRRVYKGLWMFSASSLIIILFTIATVGFFPLVEDRFTATFGPRPAEPVRFLPEAGAPFALVEDRPYRYDRFIAGMDCIWLTMDPVRSVEIAPFGPFLEADGEMIAVLGVRKTWNGMTRLFFDRGDIPMDEPIDLVIPVVGGGTIPLGDGLGYRLASPGGGVPARVVLGPITFLEVLSE
ncbi:MAG: hypothetical protein ABIK09_08290 [Pseudomonadota bacterium]